MSGMEEYVRNLEKFIATMLAAKAKAGEANQAVDDNADDLDQLESKADEGIGDFVEALEELQDSLEAGRVDVLEQIERVAGEGDRTTDDRLASLAGAVDETESDFTNTVQVGRDDLDKDAAALTESGFQFLLTSLESVQGEVDTARQAAEGAFQGFDGGVQVLQGDADTGFDGGLQAFDAAATAFASEGTEVAGRAADSESEMQTRTRAFEAEVESAGEGLTSSYETYVETIEDAGQDLVDTVHQLVEDTAAFVATSSADQIDAPVGLVMADAVPPLEDELGQVDEMLAAGDQTTAETDALSIELEKCERVVETIQELLSAIE
jgi:hypothetical protein